MEETDSTKKVSILPDLPDPETFDLFGLFEPVLALEGKYKTKYQVAHGHIYAQFKDLSYAYVNDTEATWNDSIKAAADISGNKTYGEDTIGLIGRDFTTSTLRTVIYPVKEDSKLGFSIRADEGFVDDRSELHPKFYDDSFDLTIFIRTNEFDLLKMSIQNKIPLSVKFNFDTRQLKGLYVTDAPLGGIEGRDFKILERFDKSIPEIQDEDKKKALPYYITQYAENYNFQHIDAKNYSLTIEQHYQNSQQSGVNSDSINMLMTRVDALTNREAWMNIGTRFFYLSGLIIAGVLVYDWLKDLW